MISIIIPIYNVKPYLSDCLDGVLAQTYRDWECILVDDGSSDGSGETCDEYAEQDTRFRVFHKENGGVSSARNLGIDNARGEWVSFIDADDRILPEFLQSLIETADDSDELIVGGNTYFGEEEGETVPPENIVVKREHFKDYIFNDSEWTWQRIFYVVWGKLFCLSVIKENGLKFDTNMVMSEDTVFVLLYIININSTRFVKANKYSYRFVTLQKSYYDFTFDKLKAQQDALMSAMHRIGNADIGNFNRVIYLSKGLCFHKFLLSLNTREKFVEGLKSYKKYDKDILNIFTDKKHRLYYWTLFTFPYLGYSIHKLLKK